jgi:hypothetical protein
MFARAEAFYKAHQVEFQEKYLNKWLIITESSLFGVFDTIADAFTEAQKHLKLGEFMLHRPADDGKIVSVPSCWIGNDEKEPLPESVITVSGGEPMTIPYPW